ncbi:MAG: hypothetical protein ACUVV0_07125 [Anaerolineae bacterium]
MRDNVIPLLPEAPETDLDWRELKGLGKELWAGIEAQECEPVAR